MPDKPTDIRLAGAEIHFLPVRTRVPLKFGAETLVSVTCARAKVTVRNAAGALADGWGETPLSVQWVWPSSTASYDDRHEALKAFCAELAGAYGSFAAAGHAMEVGYDFLEQVLPGMVARFNAGRGPKEHVPYLAALVCCSAFDLAIHDAYGVVNDVATYDTYNARYMTRDLSAFIEPARDARVSFTARFPCDYLVLPRPRMLPAWHLVGGKDPIESAELTGDEPNDGYPVLLRDWIRRDGLKCLKVKLRGNDAAWDYGRLVAVGAIGIEEGADWLSADFNCTVTDPAYVNDILDRLMLEHPRIYGMILYVEQPFPYDLQRYAIDVRGVSARKPLFMDESAHDWRLVATGRSLGWTGVALKTCKTQTGALLSLCWAKAHGMTLMVQDLTNPMLAQIPHCLLAAHAGTIMGVETNAMQFYPEASRREAVVHPGLYTRRNGLIDLCTIHGPGFGYGMSPMPV